jgi:hypothetical protein
MRLRIALTIVCGLALGVYAYTAEKYEWSGGVFEDLHSSSLYYLLMLALSLTTGFAVRRWWVILALLGPLLALGYLQVTGYVSPWNDGNAPLLSPPGIALFFWFGIPLLLGLALGWAQGRASSTRSGRWSEPGSSSTS